MAPLPPSPALPSSPEPRTPRATWLRLALAWTMVAAFTVFGPAWLAAPLTPLVALAAFLALFLTILAASFGVVQEADGLAHQLGEPYGTLILTLSIVLIEVILIASVLLGPGEFPTIGRDSIFAVMMIIVNLVMGICLVAGGLRHGEQEFNAQGAGVYLSMIMLLTAVSLVLPNFLAGAGEFDRLQGWAVAALTGALYAVFLWLQMRGERRLFIQPPLGQMEVRVARRPDAGSVGTDAAARSGILRGTLLLIGMIVPIVLLAHHLAIVIDYGVATVGAPVALSGVLIAIIVFTPESITAVKAALNNEMQRAVNLCLGAFVSTVGLTVPAVLVIGLVTGKTVTMGISGVETVLLVATVWLATLSFKGQRTSVLQGVMHLGLFALYGFLLFGA